MIQIRRRYVLAVASTAATLAVASLAFGASSGSSGLYMPQGSNSTSQNGDYVSTTLDTVYRYFIEVPPGLARLRVQIFDADIGAGGTGEAASGRDRGRAGGGTSFNTTANYSLFDPSGTSRLVQFTTGNTTSPTGADNAWLTFYDGNGNNVRDNFSAVSYSNNDGNHNWANSWTETGDSATAPVTTTGGIQVNTNQLRIGQVTGTPSIAREANLSATGLNLQTAWFSFTFTGSGNAADTIAVEVSSNGGTSYTTLETLTGTSAGTSRDYNITSFIASNTRVRFRVTGGLPTNRARFFFFDNIQIHDGGALTAGHWELRVDESSAASAGLDVNAIGIRADDGDETSGGTEIPIYFDSMNQFGVNPGSGGANNTRSYTAYPYVTAGCSIFEEDFDYDADQLSDVGSIAFTSRTGILSQTLASAALSTNDSWKNAAMTRNSLTGWTTAKDSSDYGIWTLGLAINTYGTPPNTSGNYTTFYVGNSSVVEPPTANPQTNAFRVYLPTDAVAAPVKPYVEQFVRFLSGPNPPVVGQTQRDTVTVRVVNPTSQAITFSATNLVTVNVPGGGAVYAGNPQKSQGTVVSTPAVGGTGNVTWNPGTVAAGATVILSYNVDVTPTSGAPVPAVGTVASGNGTKAVYVDETGNTTQSRATYTFGPLCEVTVTAATLTEAVIAGLDAFAVDRGVAVEWRTASEAGTIGFDLYRRAADGAWVKVNHDLLLGLLTAPQGGTYRFVDEGAAPRERQTYLLVEVEASGRRRNHGPFTVTPDWSRRPEGTPGDAAYARAAHAPAARAKAAALEAVTAAATTAPADALHVLVRESGLYYLSSADLAPRFGLPLQNMEKAIADGKLLLSRAGQPVAWYPDLSGKQGKGLFFYGEAVTSLFSRDNIYRLERGPGPVMSTVAASAASGAAPTVFAATAHAEQDLLPATAVALDPQKDYWFWDFVSAGDPTFGSRTFTMDAPGATSSGGGGAASLTVHLQGASATGVTGEHHPTVAVNGTALGDGHFQGITPADFTFALDPALLKPTGNQVQVGGLLDSGAPYSIFYVNSFDLSYPRTFRATGGALAFPGAASGAVAVGGFADPAVRLVDVTVAANPRWVTGAAVGTDGQGGYSLAFRSPASARYVAAATAGLKAPTAITPFRTPRLRSTANHADLVVLAGPGLHDAAQRLADYRTSQKLDSMVVDWDEVVDEFANGFPDPNAIPSFLAYAKSAWRTAPRYLVLAGAGTVDYRNLLGFGDNLVPPIFIAADGGLFPADALLADLAGVDGLPELAVGRIPAHSVAELSAYVDKVIAYETGAGGPWVGSALALADAVDQGADFAAGSERLAALFPAGYNVDRIYLDTQPLADARSHLLHQLQAGASLVDYMGHGGLDRLASGGLLASTDVATLGNGTQVPVLTAMTCSINRFAVPGFSSLGELLINQAGGGAAAVWAPSGLSLHNEAQLLAERYYRHLSDPDNPRLGDVVLRALQEFQRLGGSKSMIQIYNLLGDPALRLRRPTPGPGTPGPGSTTRE